MTLHPPFIISSRLLPAVKVGEVTISIEPDGRTIDNRPRFNFYIDHWPEFEYAGRDLCLGVGRDHNIQEAMGDLLAFLASDSDDLFNPHVREWAEKLNDDISLLGMEIEEAPKDSLVVP